MYLYSINHCYHFFMNMNTDKRIDLLNRLGNWMQSGDETWAVAKEKAFHANAWFTVAHISLAANNIVSEYLQQEKLEQWVSSYQMPTAAKTVGIVCAGNIPLVGFHDFMCGFISGHNIKLKFSSKDDILLPALIKRMAEWEPEVLNQISVEERLNGCDAYIATGSNNTSRYFEQYFGHVPHIIRRNRTSVAVLDGTESVADLELLADDVYLYYGLGCRNVTQICVPQGYEFHALLSAFNKHNIYADLNKYKNNYDYHLALYLLNRVPYMSNESILMVENTLPFSAVSVLHYRYYTDKTTLIAELKESNDIQAIIGKGEGLIPFGTSQKPSLADYADGVDTMQFLCNL